MVEPAKTLFGKVRRTYTGKIGGQNDDLAVTLQLAVSGIRCFYQNPKVRNHAELVTNLGPFMLTFFLFCSAQYDRFRPYL